jgi:outer membrane protein assembly factor BamB
MFLNTGFVKPDLLAVRLGASGELSTADVVWHYSRSVPCKPSPVLVGDWLLMINDQGVATCLEAPTGKPLWTQRIPGNYSASPIASGRRVFFCNEEGRCTVVQAEREYRELAVNTLDDGCMASPAASGNALFLRTKSHLYRIEDLAGGE